MNELKSYTEYAVSTPTADFVIGFDFNYGEDAVNVTVDNVPATEAGYTVVYLNETTIRLSPNVPSGVVRLQRETDIDQTDHAYRAGAKFIAQTMDENFEQLRHSQQEVRDGFSKLADDTYEIIDTLNEVGQSAQTAADAAEVAAQLANNAAAQVNDKVSQAELDLALTPVNASLELVKRGIANRYESSLTYNSGNRVVLTNGDIVKSTINGNTNDPNVNMTGWINKEKEQDIINSLISSEGVNILSVYGGINDFGVALELAWDKAKSIGVNTIYIPSRNYDLNTTANISLDRPLKLDFANNVTVWAKQSVDAINVVMGSQYLLIEGNGATFLPVWGTTVGQPTLLKLDSRTLSKSAKIIDINCLERDGLRYHNGINSVGLNYSLISDCLFQAVDPIVNASSPTNDGHSMGSTVRNCFLHGLDRVGTALTLINNGNLACEGWVFEGGEWFGTTGLKVINNLTSSGYLSPLLHASNVHMNCTQFAKLDGVGRVQFTGCDLQAQIESGNPHTGLFELTGVQSFVLGAGTTISQAPTTGTAPVDSLPVLSFRDSPRGTASAFATIAGANLWLYQNAPLVVFQSNGCYVGQVSVGRVDSSIFTGPIAASEYRHKINASSDSNISNISTGTGVGVSDKVSFNSETGVLTLNTSPIIGDVYQVYASVVPHGSTIRRIDTLGSIGKNYKVIFEGDNISFIHSSTLYTPSQQKLTILHGGAIGCFSYNSNICRIMDVGSHTSMLPVASVPTGTSTSGVHGQKVFSGGFVYEYIHGTGWVRYAASTF